MIVDATYYKDTYGGTYFNVDTEAGLKAFQKAEKRAELEMRKYIDITADTFSDDEKGCCCSVAEIIGIYEANKEATVKGVSSESVSGYSVSYSSGSNISSSIKKNIYDEIMLWLGMTDGMCRGVGRHVP